MERVDFSQWPAKDLARLLALREAELGYFREIAAALPIPLAIVSKDRSVTWTNRVFRRRFGERTEDLPVRGFTEIPMRAWHDEDNTETLLVFKESAEEHVQDAAPAASGGVPGDLPAIVWQADVATLQFRSVEGGAEAMLGYPPSRWLARRDFFEERIHPEDRAPTIALYRDLLSAGGEASAEYRATSAGGETVWCRETIRVSGASVIGVITNITARKQLERQLSSAGRFEALYAFAGRVAHDLNNPLMIVTGYAEELMKALKPGDPLREEAGEILGATRRIGSLAAQLSELAKQQGKPASRVNLGDTMLNLRSRITAAAGEGVAVDLTMNPAPVLALADPGQLGEVLSAVIAGARQNARDRTRITIAWDVETVAERLSPTALVAGKYARITVRDDGHGLDAEQAAGLFDPALSKTGDQESAAAGLALASAYGVVREWGGGIAFSSQPGEGSTFTIYLPYVEPEGPAQAVELRAAQVEPRLPATILVVDDEIRIRELIRKILLRERYRVLDAASGEEALAAAQRHMIDLLITDVMLPGIHGPELARRMQQAAPRLKTLFISGFTGEERVPADARFLAKPFTLAELIEKVRETLE